MGVWCRQGPPAWTEALSISRPGVNCYMPANGETVTLPTSPSIPVGISLGLLKREMAQGERQGQLGWGWGRLLGRWPHSQCQPVPCPHRAAP